MITTTGTSSLARPAALVVRLAAVAVAVAGIAFRLQSFGRYGFWNDEAWVAITTRVASPADFWLAAGTTPLGWAALLRPLGSLSPPEVWLRLVPLAFGIGTLWLTWRLGARTGMLTGLAALTVVAFDPGNIGYAKELKQYSAESFLALLACLGLVEATQRPSARATTILGCTLALGLLFSNAQLFVAPPALIVLLGDALVRRDAAAARRAAVALVLVGLAMAGWYATVMRPHLPPRLNEFFAYDFVPHDSVRHAVRFVWGGLGARLGPMMGPLGWKIGIVALAIAALVEPPLRPLAAMLLLLVIEVIATSAVGRVPFTTLRVQLFLFTTTAVLAAIALGALVVRARGPAAHLAACAVLAAVAVDYGMHHDWAPLGTPLRVEDVGPLIRRVEAARGPDDVVLLYAGSRYVWAYYQRPTPHLDPVATSVGYLPRIDDPRVRLVARGDAAFVIPRAFTDASVVWFVGSRLGVDQARIEPLLARIGTVTDREARPNAVLVRATRR